MADELALILACTSAESPKTPKDRPGKPPAPHVAGWDCQAWSLVGAGTVEALLFGVSATELGVRP